MSKFKGLMLNPSIGEYEGIVLVEAKPSKVNTSIHMFFMRFDLTAVWIDSQNRVVDVKLARRWKPYYAPSHPAIYVLETHANQFRNFQPGDILEIKND